MNIYLIGYRCTGKSVLGKMLAERLNRKFVDSDRIIENDAKLPISKIVSDRGWAFFRDLETEALKKTGQEENQVVATGGGVVVKDENIAILRRGIVIWLKASPSVILNRMGGDLLTKTQRPSLTQLSIEDEIVKTLDQRSDQYKVASSFAIETDDRTVSEILEIIIKNLALFKANIRI